MGYKHETLGRDVIPVNYKLEFTPDLKRFVFLGKEKINLSIKRPLNKININATELKVRNASIKSKDVVQECRASANDKKQVLTLSFKNKISGNAELYIEFTGKNGDDLEGFYRSKYTYDGKERYMLTSHMEATAARKAFPCFDEPEFKATYDISFVVDKEYECLSNMPVKSSKSLGKKKLVAFYTTPKMSSYLVYLGVGKYDIVSQKSGKVTIRVVTPPGKGNLAKLPLKYAVKLLPVMEKYFGIDYPLPKLDLIDIPDFAAGAMENWGAITFREVNLLGDEKLTGKAVKQRILEVVAHEMVHQWFGDLVTMEWWDDIWLNESFANFMSFKFSDMVHPEYKMMVNYRYEEIGEALAADSLKSTHPINMKVNTPGEMSSLFDSISYNKGGSVLLMLEDFVGKETFRKGLHNHLKRHMYSNATKHIGCVDLREQVKKEGRSLPARRIMDTWIEKPGYPMLNVSSTEAGSFRIEQKRFTMLEYNLKDTYPVPVHYLTDTSDGRILVTGKTCSISSKNEWVKLNYEQAGLYRVNYDSRTLARLGERIKLGKLSAIDEWGIENDLYVLARSGRMKVDSYLDFVMSYMMDCKYPANASMTGHLLWMMDAGEKRDYAARAKRICMEYNRNVLQKLGWKSSSDEDPTIIRTRSIAIGALGRCDDNDTIRKASEIFNNFIENKVSIDPNIKSAVYTTASRANSTEKMFDMLLNIYNSGEFPEDKIRALQSIGSFKSTELLEKAFDTAISGKVRRQDSILLIEMSAYNPMSRPIFFEWAKRNWKKLLGMYPETTLMMQHMAWVLDIYMEQKDYDAIKDFFSIKDNMRDDIKMAVRQSLEGILVNVKFMETNS
ncbi:MAG: M1 family metallopeptidase [Candidatus Marsarchaeota archaeon]|nr:M1 family metallopeptidase [Candidatus Marsarchaeota archaeon]